MKIHPRPRIITCSAFSNIKTKYAWFIKLLKNNSYDLGIYYINYKNN